MPNVFDEVIDLLVTRLGLDREDIYLDHEEQTITWSVDDPDGDRDKIHAKYEALFDLEPVINDLGFSVMSQDDSDYFGAVLTFDQPEEEDFPEVTLPTAFDSDPPHDPTPLTQGGKQVWHVFVGVNGPNVYIGDSCTGSTERGYLGRLNMSGYRDGKYVSGDEATMEDIVKWEARFFGTDVPPPGKVKDPVVAAKLMRAFERAQASQRKTRKTP